MFTDTDSLTFTVQPDDIYRDMADDAASRYDFSEYPLNHPIYDTFNRKALGFFKDELNSVPRFVARAQDVPQGSGFETTLRYRRIVSVRALKDIKS